MALTDRVTARLSSQRLIELTNPDNAGASSVDTTRLGYAATDTMADFEIYAGVEYDDDDERHVAVGIDGVVFHLARNAGLVAPEIEQRWHQRLEALGKVTGRNRVTPVTSSNLQASRESTASSPVRPIFDPENTGGLQLRPPRGDRGERT